MSIWEAFGMGRHKGFSREAGLLLDEAVELAGSPLKSQFFMLFRGDNGKEYTASALSSSARSNNASFARISDTES